MVKMTLRYPTTHKKLCTPSSRPSLARGKPIVSMLHQDENVAQRFSNHLDSKLDPNNISTNMDTLCQQISTSIAESVDVVCPKSVVSKSSPP